MLRLEAAPPAGRPAQDQRDWKAIMCAQHIMHTEFGPFFQDRTAAGAALAAALCAWRADGAVRSLVLGIPRGGVPVAAEVARRLDADLDVIIARKLGAPISDELAIGAVTADGGCYLNHQLVEELRIPSEYLDRVIAEQTVEAQRREARFRSGRAKLDVSGRMVIIVDDGLATGATMRAAVRSVQMGAPSLLIVAVPVGPRETCTELRQEADRVICLYELDAFFAVGLYYEHFEPTEDAEVAQILQDWHAGQS